MSDGCNQGDSCQDDGAAGTRCSQCFVEQLCPSWSPSIDGVVDAPVCGSDGRTYAGHCAVRLAACLRGLSLDVLHDGPCDELSGSGANDEPSTGSFTSYLALF